MKCLSYKIILLNDFPVICPEAMAPNSEDEKITKEISNSSCSIQKDLSPCSSPTPKISNPDQKTERMWLMREVNAMGTEADSDAESEANGTKPLTTKAESNETQEVVISEDEGHQLLQEQLAVLKAEQEKLFHETEMLKLKKEKLRLEIKLLQSKVMEDSNDVSHYIFVP